MAVSSPIGLRANLAPVWLPLPLWRNNAGIIDAGMQTWRADLGDVHLRRKKKDPMVRLEGGTVARNHGRSVSLADAVKFWRDFDGASAAPISSELPDSAGPQYLIRRSHSEGLHPRKTYAFSEIQCNRSFPWQTQGQDDVNP
jgi:hypothetical protein